jgi:small subunit ribosomal protein S24e
MSMELEILQEKENKPLGRRELRFRIEHIEDTTPSRSDVRSKLAAQYDAEASTVIIKKMETRFGIGITEGTARIYSDLNQMEQVERDYMVARHENKKEA